MEEFPEIGQPKFKLFNHSRYSHEIFMVGKYEESMKFDKIWGIKMWSPTKAGPPA